MDAAESTDEVPDVVGLPPWDADACCRERQINMIVDNDEDWRLWGRTQPGVVVDRQWPEAGAPFREHHDLLVRLRFDTGGSNDREPREPVPPAGRLSTDI